MKDKHTTDELKARIAAELLRNFGEVPEGADEVQMYKATCWVVRDLLAEKRKLSTRAISALEKKQAYYLSMEFLPGTLLHNNAYNLMIENNLREALSQWDFDLERFYELDPDAGLGNGGLGRLASCYLDAGAGMDMALNGFSICYEHGIFKQVIKNCMQTEEPDDWLTLGDCWLIDREDQSEEIHFGGKLEEVWDEWGKMKIIHRDYKVVIAEPRDLLISGYNSETVNNLRLWQATSPISIDMKLFFEGKYLQSMEEKYSAEIISKILYPEDAHREGKTLRIKQQYFFISASIQSLTKKHYKKYGTLDNFHELVALHINDTHPAMAIPELMRILMDDYEYQWDKAWDIVNKTISYTNHTVMPEALEKWPEDLFKELLPRIHSIIAEISRRAAAAVYEAFPYDEVRRNGMPIISNGMIHMANLCVTAAHKVNGVSSLHSGIIKDQLFSGFSAMNPEKFTNVTNGIAYRRWLCQSNPGLSKLLDETCGPGYRKNADVLEDLLRYKEDVPVLEQLMAVKKENKQRLADYVYKHNGISLDTNSIFDIQVKRLHEYKRQLLNLFHIMDMYNSIKENPNVDLWPRTFIFGAKAAAGYGMAKQIISLACNLSEQLEKDPIVRDRIKIVFMENYSVSLSEIIMPSADISEQISLAGKEASGTGNMKLMINGAVTLGTEDGANVEIHRAVGDDNIFIFGMSVEQVEALKRSGNYNPWMYTQNDSAVSGVFELLNRGINGINFGNTANSLITGYNGAGDQYFILADYADYKRAHRDADKAYRDKTRWAQMSLTNISKSGIFSADRAVKEYSDRIWNIRNIYD